MELGAVAVKIPGQIFIGLGTERNRRKDLTGRNFSGKKAVAGHTGIDFSGGYGIQNFKGRYQLSGFVDFYINDTAADLFELIRPPGHIDTQNWKHG